MKWCRATKKYRVFAFTALLWLVYSDRYSQVNCVGLHQNRGWPLHFINHSDFTRNLKFKTLSLADPRGKGGARDAPPGVKILSFSCSFGQKKLKNNSTFGSCRTPSGKSWIRHWMYFNLNFSWTWKYFQCPKFYTHYVQKGMSCFAICIFPTQFN